MNLTREEAASFLNKLATDSKPLLVFTTGSWGFSLFIGSIVHLDATHLIINQNRDVLIPVIVFLENCKTFHYGDIRELTGRLSTEASSQLGVEPQYLSSVIEGGIVLEFSSAEVVGLVEVNTDNIAGGASS